MARLGSKIRSRAEQPQEKEGNFMGKNEMQVFQNDQFGEVRTVMRDGEPWFVGKDVAEILGYKNTKDALITHVDDEDKRVIQRSEITTFENNIPRDVLPVNFVSADVPNRGMTIINESGVYALVFGSKLPAAKAFKHWITYEVLPSIRKYGMYASSGIFTNPDTMAALVQALQHEQARSERLQRRLNWLVSPSAQKVLEAEHARREDNGDELPERAARLFVETIYKMLDDGEARVRLVDEPGDGEETDDLIGFIDDDFLYAIPQKTYETVARHCRAEGDSFPISRSILNRCLRQLGMIEPDQRTETATKPKWVEGRAKRLLWIPRDKMK